MKLAQNRPKNSEADAMDDWSPISVDFKDLSIESNEVFKLKFTQRSSTIVNPGRVIDFLF